MKSYEDHWLTSHDGLRLYARDYPNPNSPAPILCMHGLTRNSSDFAQLAESLNPQFRLIVADQRGRGRSDYDANPANYNVMTYVADTFALLDELELSSVIMIGTSMGGLMAMIMASQQPERVRGLVLNDVGPVVEADGIARIQGYVGNSGEIASWEDAVELARANNGLAFPDWNDADWLAFARKLFVEDDSGVPRLSYDPAISAPLSSDQGSAVPPAMWPVFDSIADIPTLVIRGAISDILSRQTVAEMARRHHNLTHVEVAGRGHAPTLDEAEALKAIHEFLDTL